MSNIRISLMEKCDLKESARVLSVAMQDAKLHQAVFMGAGEKERREIEVMFKGLFTQLPGIIFLARENQTIAGVMRMKSCEGSQRPELDDIEPPKGGETDIEWRKKIWHSEWARHDPRHQHWHLGPIGVLPSCQGKGIGTLLMKRFCQEVDTCMADAYLETDVMKNVLFYKKFGFEVVAESDIFGVQNRYMLRPAKVSTNK